jgi:glycine/D-amino acid oxidase-like deaminating enzyme
VTVLERGLPGAANSTRQGGGIRQQFGTELNIRLSVLSADTWDQFADRYGVDPLFRPIGYRRPLLEPLGLMVAVVGRRHELLIVEPAEPLPLDLPWLIGVEDGVHVRNDAEGRVQVGGFLGEDRAVDPDRYDMHAQDDWMRAVLSPTVPHLGAGADDAEGMLRGFIDRPRGATEVGTGFGTGLSGPNWI